METTLARASLYNFLAAAFGDPPTPELIAAVRQAAPGVEPAALDELRRVYTRLLIGPGAGYVPPYASVHLRDEGRVSGDCIPVTRPSLPVPLLWGPEAAAVEALYREAGLDVAPGQPRVPDHLALELQFMQHLCARQADAEARGDLADAAGWRDRQRAFLRDHLWPWLPRFASRIGEVEAHSVYRALADFALSFVQTEMAGD